MKLKYRLERLRWWKVLFSPLKPFTIKWYVGKLALGTPYFYPRKWVKATPERAKKAALDHIKRQEDWNKANPNSKFQHTIKPFDELYKDYLKHRFAVQIKVGFDSCSLGWKTKWTDTDFRFEHGPMLTFVFFGYQIAAIVKPPTDWPSPYWEIWLCYEYATDKTKSKSERIKQCREIMPQIWRSSKNGVETRIDYYEQVVKPKYLK
jgi:hypothetical protein